MASGSSSCHAGKPSEEKRNLASGSSSRPPGKSSEQKRDLASGSSSGPPGGKKKKYKRSVAGWRKQQQCRKNFSNRVTEQERQMAEWAKLFNKAIIKPSTWSTRSNGLSRLCWIDHYFL